MNISEPGMSGLWQAFPATAAPLSTLANTLLTKETLMLSRRERELIASFASRLNNCAYCEKIHAIVADNLDLQDKQASLTLNAYLAISEKVCKNTEIVSEQDMEWALLHGATRDDIHDVILISAAFCMFSRYVRHTLVPSADDDNVFTQSSCYIIKNGYVLPS